MRKRKLWVSIMAGVLAALMLLSILAGILPIGARAASSSEIREQINELEDQEAELEAQMEELEQQIQANVGEMSQIVAQKSIIDQQVFLLQEKIANINEQIAAYGVLIADKQDELDAARSHYEELNAKNKERIRAMEEDGELSYWSVLFKANSFSDLLDRLSMIEEIAAADQRRMKELTAAAEKMEEAQEELEAEKAGLEVAKQEVEADRLELEEKRAAADQLLAELNAKGMEYEAMMDEAEAAAEDLIAQIAEKEAEYDAAVDAEYWATYVEPTYPPYSGSGTYNPSGVYWASPLDWLYVSSPYGYRVHPVYGDWRFHSGVDFGIGEGSPIYATRSGVVTTATYDWSAGYYVTINHGDGFASSYLHMTHYIVSAGDYVDQGQIIGYVGSTGTSTGPHLHFTIYYNGSTVNPMEYL